MCLYVFHACVCQRPVLVCRAWWWRGWGTWAGPWRRCPSRSARRWRPPGWSGRATRSSSSPRTTACSPSTCSWPSPTSTRCSAPSATSARSKPSPSSATSDTSQSFSSVPMALEMSLNYHPSRKYRTGYKFINSNGRFVNSLEGLWLSPGFGVAVRGDLLYPGN